MRANADRSAALEFGKLADHYDAGRLPQTLEFVQRTTARLGAPARARRLEVGAGTGQLTGSLLAAGGDVVAVEPAPQLAGRLKRNYSGDLRTGRLRVLTQLFETLEPAAFAPLPQIWSSDAWHWVDPAAGYRLAAALLAPGGLLICSWRFPVLADAGLQRRLNQVYARLSPDLVRAREKAHLGEVEPLLAAGRREVSDSGHMATADYWTEEYPVRIPVDTYAELQLSFAQIAALSADQQAELAGGIREMAAGGGRTAVTLRVWQYTVASRPVAAPAR